MKDEEVAREFANSIDGPELAGILLGAGDANHAYRLGRYEGFLAGLEAGRQDGHLTKAKELLKTCKDFIEYEGLTTRLSKTYDKMMQFLKED